MLHKQELSFFIPCVPPKATSQQKGAISMGDKGIRFFKKKAVREAEAVFIDLLKEHVPESPFTGPLSLKVVFTWPWRASEPKKRKEKAWVPMDKKPDCSNIIKLLEDTMQLLLFFENDSQISNLTVVKGWGNYPGILLELMEWDGALYRNVALDKKMKENNDNKDD